MRIRRTKQEQVKCAKITMKLDGERMSFFGCDSNTLNAYIFIEIFNDIYIGNKNKINELKDRIKVFQQKINNRKTDKLSDEIEEHEHILSITELKCSVKIKLGLFLSVLNEHINDYKQNKDWVRLLKLSEDLRLDELSRENFTNDISAVLDGKLKNLYDEYRESERIREEYMRKNDNQQHIKRITDEHRALNVSKKRNG